MSFDLIAGQDRAVAALRRMLRSSRTPHALIFAGPPGVGKMTTALEFAKALVCAKQADDACGRCPHCRKAEHGTHPDIYRVEPEGDGRQIKIEVFHNRKTGEGLLKTLNLKPNEAKHKVVLIDQAEAMNGPSANCFLKTLEEPPPQSVLVLVTPRPDDLPETIVSRCQVIRFCPLAQGIVRDALEKHGLDAATARFLAQSSGGSLGRATEMAGETALPAVRMELLRLVTGLHEGNLIASAARVTQIVRELATARAEAAATPVRTESRSVAEWLLDLAVLFYRDVAVRQVGVDPDRMLNQDVADLIDKETSISRRGIRSILDRIEEAKGFVRANVDIDATVLDTFSGIAACRDQRAA